MVNIHEALEKAKKEQQARRRQMAEQKQADLQQEQPQERHRDDAEMIPVVEPVRVQPQPAPAVEALARVDSKVVTFFDPGSLASEQFRSIRTALTAIRERTLRSLVLTSASRGEGKTTVTANLGVVLAGDLDQRVLLIDGDLRKPRLGQMFGVPPRPGLTDVLMGNIGHTLSELEQDVIRPTDMDRLDVLPCGTMTSNPTELLGSRQMQLLIEKLTERYTRILIDSPPIVAVTDASVIGALADGTLLVIQAGETRREVITRALSLLSAARNNVIGCILNGIEYHIPNYIYRYI